jgi:hypothetical protein
VEEMERRKVVGEGCGLNTGAYLSGKPLEISEQKSVPFTALNRITLATMLRIHLRGTKVRTGRPVRRTVQLSRQ